MKPAVAPMVKPAHIEDMRMLDGEPASSKLLRAHTPDVSRLQCEIDVLPLFNMLQRREEPYRLSSQTVHRQLWL